MELYKKFTTVIMDASDVRKVEKIRAIIRLAIGTEKGMEVFPIRSDSPAGTIAIKADTSEMEREIIQLVLDKKFPGMCIYHLAS